MSRKRTPTPDKQRRHLGPGEDVSVDEVIDMQARRNGIDPHIFEELTIADLRRLGVQIRQAPTRGRR